MISVVGSPLLLEILASEDADEDSVGMGDDEVSQVLVTHALCDRASTRARPDRARSGSHRILRAHVLAGA